MTTKKQLRLDIKKYQSQLSQLESAGMGSHDWQWRSIFRKLEESEDQLANKNVKASKKVRGHSDLDVKSYQEVYSEVVTEVFHLIVDGIKITESDDWDLLNRMASDYTAMNQTAYVMAIPS